jgi:hypothetical protein
VGSVQIAGGIAALIFPILVVWGLVSDELGLKAVVILVALGAAAWFALPAATPSGGYLVTPALAVLDIVLVLMVFKRDIRIG